MPNDSMGTIPDWITAVVAFLAAGFAAIEYLRQGKWKQQELEQELIDALGKDQTLALACHALDWGFGPAIVPERYRPLVGGRDVVNIDPAKVFEAMRPSITAAFSSDPELKLYRVCFDDFFGHLERIHRHTEQRRVPLQELQKGLDYWLWRIVTPQYCPSDKDPLMMFLDFLEAADYRRVVQLLTESAPMIQKRIDQFRFDCVAANRERQVQGRPLFPVPSPWPVIEGKLRSAANAVGVRY